MESESDPVLGAPAPSPLALLRSAAGAATDDELLSATLLNFSHAPLPGGALPELDLVSGAATVYAQFCGLRSLAGAEALAGLTWLSVQSNALTSLAPLAACARLVFLDARDNALAPPLAAVAAPLPRGLRTLRLAGNACAAPGAARDAGAAALAAERPALALALDDAAAPPPRERAAPGGGAGGVGDRADRAAPAATASAAAALDADAADAAAEFAALRAAAVARSRARAAAGAGAPAV